MDLFSEEGGARQGQAILRNFAAHAGLEWSITNYSAEGAAWRSGTMTQ